MSWEVSPDSPRDFHAAMAAAAWRSVLGLLAYGVHGFQAGWRAAVVDLRISHIGTRQRHSFGRIAGTLLGAMSSDTSRLEIPGDRMQTEPRHQTPKQLHHHLGRLRFLSNQLPGLRIKHPPVPTSDCSPPTAHAWS